MNGPPSDSNDPTHPGNPSRGSSLCLACGLCCRGVLHDHVVLAPGEAAAARRAGLPIVGGRGSAQPPTFTLPCSRYGDDRCTIYPRRPMTCRAYRCGLLERFLNGSVAHDEARGHVRRARRLEAAIHDALAVLDRPPDDAGTLWQRLDRVKRQGEELPPEVLLDAAELGVLCRRQFLAEREKHC